MPVRIDISPTTSPGLTERDAMLLAAVVVEGDARLALDDREHRSSPKSPSEMRKVPAGKNTGSHWAARWSSLPRVEGLRKERDRGQHAARVDVFHVSPPRFVLGPLRHLYRDRLLDANPGGVRAGRPSALPVSRGGCHGHRPSISTWSERLRKVVPRRCRRARSGCRSSSRG